MQLAKTLSFAALAAVAHAITISGGAITGSNENGVATFNGYTVIEPVHLAFFQFQ